MSTNHSTIPANNHNTRISSPHPTAVAMNQHNNPKTTQDTATMIQNQIQQLKQQAENLETTAAKLREIANILELQRKEFVMNHSQQQQQQQASSSFSNSITNTNTTEEAPLDEHGNPKYKGKKRGRKPKKRKRCLTKKRGHTAYTLFVQEAYPKVKEEYTSQPELKFQSKNIINIIAQRWKELSPEEKLEWKQRAQTLSELGLEMEASDEKQCDATEGDLNHNDNVIQEDHVTQDTSMLLVGESHPPNSIHNLHPVPVAPALEIGNHTNVENVHNFAPIDIGMQLQMQMTNALDHTIVNDSVADNHERLQDIHATGMIQDPHVFRF